MLPHAAGLYGNLTARENIAYFGALQGIPARACASAPPSSRRGLAMEGFLERRAKGFSQGQRIKVALARALVHDPANLVLDEPTNGLDVMAIRNLRDMLLTLKSQGRCILFSSHVMQEVAALCDRVVIIGARPRARAGHPAVDPRARAAPPRSRRLFCRCSARPRGSPDARACSTCSARNSWRICAIGAR